MKQKEGEFSAAMKAQHNKYSQNVSRLEGIQRRWRDSTAAKLLTWVELQLGQSRVSKRLHCWRTKTLRGLKKSHREQYSQQQEAAASKMITFSRELAMATLQWAVRRYGKLAWTSNRLGFWRVQAMRGMKLKHKEQLKQGESRRKNALEELAGEHGRQLSAITSKHKLRKAMDILKAGANAKSLVQVQCMQAQLQLWHTRSVKHDCSKKMEKANKAVEQIQQHSERSKAIVGLSRKTAQRLAGFRRLRGVMSGFIRTDLRAFIQTWHACFEMCWQENEMHQLTSAIGLQTETLALLGFEESESQGLLDPAVPWAHSSKSASPSPSRSKLRRNTEVGQNTRKKGLEQHPAHNVAYVAMNGETQSILLPQSLSELMEASGLHGERGQRIVRTLEAQHINLEVMLGSSDVIHHVLENMGLAPNDALAISICLSSLREETGMVGVPYI